MVKALRDIIDEDGFIICKGRLYNVVKHDRKNRLVQIESEQGLYWLQIFYLKFM